MDYTIAAIPTVYNGRRYRSRLEARWAAFFDILGWKHEYEPRDLGKWSPDFALWVRRKDAPILAEVKPISMWDRYTARKIADAAYDTPGSHFLLLGTDPEEGQLGWLGQWSDYEAQWTEALLGTTSDGLIDFFANSGSFCQQSLLREYNEPLLQRTFELEWKSAANAVQWHPAKGRKS